MRALLFAAVSSLALAQGTATRLTPGAYQTQATTGDVTFGANFMVRTVFDDAGSAVMRNYLVVDVAVFSKAPTVNLSLSYFSLRVNGRTPILAQQPFLVAASMDPSRPAAPGAQPGLTVGAGVGNAGVIIGGQPGGLPGQPLPDPNNPNPQTRRPPETPNPYVVERPAPPSPRELVQNSALPSGDVAPPVSGNVFFAYQDKPEEIRSLELLYDGPAGKATLKLR
jgi:hypothetical protein